MYMRTVIMAMVEYRQDSKEINIKLCYMFYVVRFVLYMYFFVLYCKSTHVHAVLIDYGIYMLYQYAFILYYQLFYTLLQSRNSDLSELIDEYEKGITSLKPLVNHRSM